MVKSSERVGSTTPPFLKKCYEMVDDQATDSIISWGQNQDSFVIWDMTHFSVNLLPKFFKHSNFSSFMRQLNIYGFKKIDTDRWEFAANGFIKDQKHLLKNICRRKNIQALDQQKALQPEESSPETDEKKNENFGLWNEVEILKTDKNVLMQELVKVRQHQETATSRLLILRDRLNGMEKNHQQILSFLVMAVQNPSYFIQLLQPKENNWSEAEVRNMLEPVIEDIKEASFDGAIVRYQPPKDDIPMAVLSPISGSGKQHQESDLFLDEVKDFFLNCDFMKVMMDEKLCPLEHSGPFILPDLHDETSWEQLLLSSPSSRNTEYGELDGEGPTDSEMETDLTMFESPLEESESFQFWIEQMERSENIEMESVDDGAQMEKTKSVELITEQMELLAANSEQKENVHNS